MKLKTKMIPSSAQKKFLKTDTEDLEQPSAAAKYSPIEASMALNIETAEIAEERREKTSWL